MNREPEQRTLTTGEFLKWFFEYIGRGFIEFYYMLPEGVDSIKGQPRKFTQYAALPLANDIPDSPQKILGFNAQGYSVFFGTTPSPIKVEPEQKTADSGKPYVVYPRRKASTIEVLPALWCDIDTKEPDKATETLLSLQFKPNVIITTGGGIHAYWKLAKPIRVTDDNRDSIKKLLHAIAVAVKGDTQCKDLARIMRLPGTANTKPERNNALCSVTHTYGGMRFYEAIYNQFRAFIPVDLPKVTRSLNLQNSGISDDLPPVVQKYLSSPPFQGERNQKLYAAARACNDAGLSIGQAESLLTTIASQTGLPQHEIDTAIRSAYHAARSLSTYNNQDALRMGIRDRMMSK